MSKKIDEIIDDLSMHKLPLNVLFGEIKEKKMRYIPVSNFGNNGGKIIAENFYKPLSNLTFDYERFKEMESIS
ncbi:MAG: hypothetical protein KA734_03215 [Fluviicola sp.]|nr:hypothetical protein [Fluviicola sp.]MBP6270927.1 hypothetical protein [Fluviicola sp.]